MSPESTPQNPGSLWRGDFSLTLRIMSRLDQIRLIRAALAGVMSHLEIADSDIYSLGLAVTEIINNSMEHGYKGDEDKEIEVRLHIGDSEVQVDIIDSAPPFPEEERYRLTNNLKSLEDPSEEWTMRGHGLQIVRRIVDSIMLDTKEDYNCMRLRKIVGMQNAKAEGERPLMRQ